MLNGRLGEGGERGGIGVGAVCTAVGRSCLPRVSGSSAVASREGKKLRARVSFSREGWVGIDCEREQIYSCERE